MLDILVVSPTTSLVQSAPGGLGYLSEVYDAASLKDRLTYEQLPDAWLMHSLRRLHARYPGRLSVRWLDPYSLRGLWTVARHRIREFPTILVGSQTVPISIEPSAFEDLVADKLASLPG